MNRSIRRVALGLGLAFAALFAQLNYVQIARSTALSEHPKNWRLLVAEYSVERGQIIAGNDVLAESVPTDDRLKFRRQYPLSALYGPITGYYSLLYGRAGLERTFNEYLVGDKPPSTQDFIDDLLGRERKGNSLILSIDPKLQKIARTALGKQRGAVAALDPATGNVLALWGYPSFDPNPLSTHDPDEMREAWDGYNSAKSKPLVFRATQERYPPGSTFKIVTAAAGLELGKMTPQTTFPDPRILDLPDTDKNLRNYQGGSCAGGRISMATGFRVSCNSTFAQIGLKIGAEKLIEMAERFGIDSRPDFDIYTVPSCIRPEPGAGCRTAELNRPSTAYSAIGQFDVRVTPLQMALIGATVANNGRVPRPRLVTEVQDFAGRTVEKFEPELSDPIYSSKTAKALRQMMIDTVRSGTGRPVAIRGVEMGGKTGTAQTGIEGQPPHVWFVAFAKGIAVAVVVENGGDAGADATGGRVAGPIAKALIQEVAGRS